MSMRAGALQLPASQFYGHEISARRTFQHGRAQQLPQRHALAVRRRLVPSPVRLRELQPARPCSSQQPDPDSTQLRSYDTEGSYLSDSELEEEELSSSPPAHRQQHHQHSIVEMLAEKPLELASELSKQDAHYLQKRSRVRWWSGSEFPRVPPPTEKDKHVDSPFKTWVKIVPLASIFFCASFNLTILQNLKDAIIVTTAGAETLPFLASCVVLPASLAFFMLYGKLLENLPQQTVFYAAISPLVGFYALFTAVLYPLHSSLHLTGLTSALAPSVPLGLHGLLKVVEYWTFSLFFCAAEIWGGVVISVLFWTLANEVCTVSEAKTVYPLMGIAANVALVLSGNWVKFVNSHFTRGSTQAMLNYLIGTVLVMTGVMAAAKWSIDRVVLASKAAHGGGGKQQQRKKKKSKGSLGDSFKVIRESPKVLNLALLVVSYGVSHRLFEFAWKGQLRVLYPTAAQYQSVLADVSIATGWATITLMVLGKFVFQHLGWITAAAATPVVMLVSGAAFFGLSLAANKGLSVGGLNPAAMAVAGAAAGAVTQVFARSSKFSLFDPAKEMVYIEMSQEEKSRGKAAVDLLGSQIGKSGGAWITQALLLLTGSITGSLPIIAAAFSVVILSWIRAVFSLASQLKEFEAQKVAKATAAAASDPADAAPEPSAAESTAAAAAASDPADAAPEPSVADVASAADGQAGSLLSDVLPAQPSNTAVANPNAA